MSNFASSSPVILKGLRASWLDIYKPGDGMNGGAPKFKFSGLMEPDSEALKVGKAAMLEAATKLWGTANAANMIRSMSANSRAIRDGNDKMADDGTVRPEYKDMFYLSSSNKADKKPQVVGPARHPTIKDANGQPAFIHITEAGRALVNGMDVTDDLPYEVKVPYRGCYVNAKVEFVAGKQFTGKDKQVIPNQVFARIIAIQFVKDGEAFGSGPTSAEGFGDEEVESAASGGANDLF